MPKQQSDVNVLLNRDEENPAPFPAYLPLHIFDDEEFDIHTAEEWISLGNVDGVRYPVPGLALLPTKEEDRMSMHFSISICL